MENRFRICTICARGGSKGVKGKNIRQLGGQPLIAHSIKLAIDSKVFETICVSSDSEEILAIAQAAGAEVLVERPPHMASDTAGKMDSIKHAVMAAERETEKQFATVVDLAATSPLRVISDVTTAIEILETTDCSSVITGSQARRSPYFDLVELDEHGKINLSKNSAGKILRRQDSPSCFDMNGSIYVWNRNMLLEDPRVFYEDTRLLLMPPTRSIDIDSEFDWFLLESVFNSQIYLDGLSVSV